jgi:hypothetical protein
MQSNNTQQRQEYDFRHYVPVHSDFLIHWTGKDIDHKYDQDWIHKSSSITSEHATEAYLVRLKGILKFGLWMTKDEKERTVQIGGKAFKRPCPARTCFTELKLSTARSHAARYGRLGIGFKRLFLVKRLGGPMMYYQNKAQVHFFFPPFLSGGRTEFTDDDFSACFLKPMVEELSQVTFVYTHYDESEWRIIYSTEIECKLNNSHQTATEYFRRTTGIDEKEFTTATGADPGGIPEFLIPVKDQWFSMIIYPSLSVKVEAEADTEIRRLLGEAKPPKPNAPQLSYETLAPWEKYSSPIEIDLDACRNF